MSVKFSDLANLATVTGTTIIPVVDTSGTFTSKKIYGSTLKTYIESGLANVASTNSYNDLDDLPTIPTHTGNLTNNSGFITSASLTWSNVSGKPTFANIATTGDSANLTINSNLIATSNLVYSLGSTSYYYSSLFVNSITLGNILINETTNALTSTKTITGPNLVATLNTTTGNLTVNDNAGVSGNLSVSQNINTSGDVDILGDGIIEGEFTANGNIIVSNVYVPSANTSPGTQGQITWDNTYVYICVATNTWKRASLGW